MCVGVGHHHHQVILMLHIMRMIRIITVFFSQNNSPLHWCRRTHHLEFSNRIEGSPNYPQERRNHHQQQYSVDHPCKKQSEKNPFVISNNMVPERESFPLVIKDHPCHPLLHLIRFLCISEGTEVTLQFILLYILCRWELPVLHYPRNMVIYHYPPIGVF